jgi:hypothetical protein
MRRWFVLAIFILLSTGVSAATPFARGEAAADKETLREIAGWLREHGRAGYIGGDVADAVGLPRMIGEELLAARQRGFKSDDELRIAQVSADGRQDFILFMVQRPDDQVYFYLSTAAGGLQKALVSIPSKNLVVPLDRLEAEPRFRREVLYWKDRSDAR